MAVDAKQLDNKDGRRDLSYTERKSESTNLAVVIQIRRRH